MYCLSEPITIYNNIWQLTRSVFLVIFSYDKKTASLEMKNI